MDLKEYQNLASRTDAPIEETYEHMHSLHMVLGMVTEVGELADVFKKNLAYDKPIDWVNVGEELADVMWYIVNFCKENNINLESELSKNIQKLKVRFPNNFTSKDAQNRNLDAEREVLESKPKKLNFPKL